ncbi:PDR/VanB family oxidoreductase [Paraburkholderia sp.]|uniref:PDR/VanB family oxidoreductase n=1 Tax=Paraburkholderia sp. TaxID=1926495 RepID=UPI003C7AFD23
MSQRLSVQISSVERAAEGIWLYRLTSSDEGELPAASPGAHVDVFLSNGQTRQYSLCQPPGANWYNIAVKLETEGRGGSRHIVETWHAGQSVLISTPRNNFPLAEGAASSILIAGGIGITPILAMAQELHKSNQPYRVYVCARNSAQAPFRDALAPMMATGNVVMHYDGGDIDRQLDLRSILRDPQPGAHLYYCGPPGMMRAVAAASTHWPAGTVHREYFSVQPTPLPTDDDEVREAFSVRLVTSGVTVAVSPGQSIVEALRTEGIEVPTSCESGLCGACKTRLLGGTADHRDFVLEDNEREDYVLICCAKARSDVLVLDL